MDTSQITATVDSYLDAATRQDVAAIRKLYADDAVVEDPVGSEPHRGIEAISAFYERSLTNNARMQRVGSVRCAGNSAAFCFDVHVSGMKIEVIDVFEFGPDGKIVSMKAYWGPGNVVQ